MFFSHYSLVTCEITYSNKHLMRGEVISRKESASHFQRKRGCIIVSSGLAILTYIDRGQSPLRFSVISSENASYSGRGECQMIDDMGAQQAICTSWRKLLSKWQRSWRLYVICRCLSRSYFCAPTPQILKFLMER